MPNTDINGIKNRQRLTYIDPNTFASYFSHKSDSHIHTQELAWNPEDLAMSVDLQVIIPSRRDKGEENYFIKLDDIVMHNSGKSPIARYVSYMGGMQLNQKDSNNSYLTDNYTNISFQEIKDGKLIDKESLGINSIDINFDAHFFPIVTIKFTDVRGSSLFMPSEYEFEESLRGNSSPGSFFKALFHFPYPRFLLSIKGFYGNRVTFQLAVSDFRSEFQQETGNYDITVQFIGYVYGLYTDLPLNLVMASPYYNWDYWVKNIDDGVFRYVTDDGNVGGEMKTYLDFLTALDDRDVTSDLLENTSYTISYRLKKQELSLLQSISKLHAAMLDNTIGKEVTTSKRSSDNNIFVWGTYDTKNNSNVDSTGFLFDAEISKKYYQKIREYLNVFGVDSEYTKIIRNDNIFLDNISTKLGSNALNIIKNDVECRYLPAFKTVKGVDIKSLFTFQNGKPNIVDKNDGFLKKISDVGGDEVLLQDTRFKHDGDLKHGTKLKQDVEFGIVINKTKYLSTLKNEIKLLEDELNDSIIDVTNELKSVFESVIGFTPTVENFYRMLFAHIDCFMHYFNKKILGDIIKQTNNKERKLYWFNNGDGDELKLSQLDIPKTLSGGSDKTAADLDIYPFPGYYVDKQSDNGIKTVAEFPGKSDNVRFQNIREVSGVEKILRGVNFITEKIKELTNSSDNLYTGDVFSILSPIYNGSNPWDSIDFSFADEKTDAYKMLYFYMCLLAADKAVGTGVYNDLTDSDNYVTRVVNLLRGKVVSAPETFVKTLQTIIDEIKTEGKSLKTTVLDNISRYTMNNFVVSQESRDKLVIDNRVKDSDGNYVSDDNYIPLKIVGKNLNKPISNILEEDVDKHWAVNISDSEKVTNYTSITGYGMLSGGFSDEEKCKEYNDKLITFEEGKEYLSDINEISYGSYCVSMPKTNDTTTVDYSDWAIEEHKKNKTGYRKQIAYDLYKLSQNNNKFRHKYHRLNSGIQEYSWNDLTIYPKIDDVTTDIKKYYKDGADSAEKYPVNFVGRKDAGHPKNKENAGETGYGTPYIYYDDNPSVNLFSGIKTYSIFDGDSEINLIKEGKPETVQPSGCDDSIWKSFKSHVKNGDYSPLIETTRCKADDVSEEDSKYAFGTYLCAILSGVNALSSIVNKVNKCKISEPVRLVEILYLGGVLYFQEKYKNEGKIDDATKFYELIKSDGQLGHGLLLHDRNATLLKDQNEVKINVISWKDKSDMFINKFKWWCDNELFGGIYESLVFIDNESETSDANPEYEDLLAFTGESNPNRRTIVQGYTKGSVCEQWLTNLTYSYTHLISVSSCKNDKKNVNVTREDIVKFLEMVINKVNAETTNDNANSEELSKNSMDVKTALYYTLKNLYDKWLCTYTANEFKLKKPIEDLKIRQERFCGVSLKDSIGNRVTRKNLRTSCSEYNNFVYVDQFYNDISGSFILDADKIGGLIKDIFRGKTNIDVYSFMSQMAEKNNLMLIALPVFNNMYNASSIASVFSPNTLYNMTNYDGENGVGTTYVVMYANEVSHQPSLYEGYEYNRDYIDIAGILDNSYGSDDLKYFGNAPDGSKKLNYNVSAFAVTYGKQNQMYFKRVNVSMDNPKTTDESIRNQLALSEAASQGPTEQPLAIGQNIYSIYSNRSYTCTVEMLGCVNITPLMYFQLNNVPMFRGLYMIINVKHSIKAGDMTTIFTGVRVSRYSLPDVNDILMHSSIYRRVMQMLDETNISIDGIACSDGSSRSNDKASTKLSNNWISCVEQMGTWYQNNIHTYQGAKNCHVKNRPGKRYYDCNLIGGASVCDDCSSFVKACLQAYGLSELDKLSITTATMQPGSNFAEILQQYGFVRLPYSKSERKKGDIMVGGSSTHTEIYWGDGKSQGWGNTHDGLNNNDRMPCATAEKNYKHIYRLQA